jgi:hypothetical protein
MRSRYPIFQSLMTWIARAPLVTAVSSVGVVDLLEYSIAATGFPVEHSYINSQGLSWQGISDLASVRRGRDGDANESLAIAHLVGW